MTLSSSRVGLIVGLVFAATVGCGDSCCTDDVVDQVGEPVCQLGTCDGTDAFRFGSCVEGGCASDAECCPGTRCRVDVNTCFPILLDSEFACDSNADCEDPAQRCLNTVIGNRDPLPTCVYELCSTDSDCGFGRTCYEQRCVVTAPCDGACPSGTACDMITGKCAPFPAQSAGCDVDCGPSALKVFTDPNTMSGEACCDLACECAALPPIVPTRFGKYSRVVHAIDEVLVSAYDAQFGDLVVARFKTDGSFSRVDYIDGVPSGGAVVADPLGPRGGVAEPGENVGTHTSIAADAAGLARIAYHDEDGRSLKVAIEQAAGGFTTHFVDGGDDADAKVGQFTDIAVAADGTIFVTYLAHNTTLAGQPGKATGVKLARSRTPTPTSAADWDLLVLDARPMFDPCGGACAAGNVCVLNSGSAQCLPETTGCDPACSASQSCVNTGPGAVCAGAPLTPESPEVPRARGLFSSITLDGATAVVAYYDAIDGDLRVAQASGTTVTTAVVDGDGESGRRTGDVGRFPTVAKIGENFTIVYEDFGRHEVRSWSGSLAELGVQNGGAYALVDRGQEAGRSGKLFVGAGARLAQGAANPVVVYQDASNLNLKIAAFDGTSWVPGPLVTEGAHGFYSDIAIADGQAYIVSVEARLDDRGIEASRVGLLVQPAP